MEGHAAGCVSCSHCRPARRASASLPLAAMASSSGRCGSWKVLIDGSGGNGNNHESIAACVDASVQSRKSMNVWFAPRSGDGQRTRISQLALLCGLDFLVLQSLPIEIFKGALKPFAAGGVSRGGSKRPHRVVGAAVLQGRGPHSWGHPGLG